MQKIVINVCHGGFSLSWRAEELYEKLSGKKVDYFYDIDRSDPHLVQAVEELGVRANGVHADLAIVEIPDGVQWEIAEYDGMEHVAEKHRRWYK